MEFPRNPSRRQRRQQEAVSITISGMQDILLEPSAERLDQLLEAAYDLPGELGSAALSLIDINKL